jgi:ElaB/YqjD/DUF883 family membrane-anchored ribosome-binding protein
MNDENDPSFSSNISNSDSSVVSTKPWFLSSCEIYKLIKHSILLLPYSETLFQKSLHGITLVTNFLNDKVASAASSSSSSSSSSSRNPQANKNNKKGNHHYLPLTEQECSDLLNKVDAIISEELIMLDDGFDDLRSKLSGKLQGLRASLLSYQQNIRERINESLDSSSASLTAACSSRYDQSMTSLALLIQELREKHPKITEKLNSITSTAKNLESSSRSSLQRYASSLLTTAQPFVHSAVNVSLPYLIKAQEISSPYYEQYASSYVQPVLNKAVNMEHSLKENKLLGNYIIKLEETSLNVIKEIEHYALTSSPTSNGKIVCLFVCFLFVSFFLFFVSSVFLLRLSVSLLS